MVNSKSAFWKALVFTIIIFILGLIFGYFFEGTRLDKTQKEVMSSEISLLDEQLRAKVLDDSNLDCSIALDSSFNFADRIYAEAMLLEKYDSKSNFIDTLQVVHKRYDLLRMMLWAEAKELKKKCPDEFNTLVYFFDYNSEDIDLQAKQTTFSRMLIDLKEKHPKEILLIPIAANLNLSSIDEVMKFYNISSAPAIIINEKRVINQITPITELENIIFQSNKE